MEENITHNGEEIDEDESQHGSENNGAAIAGDTFDDIQQGLFSVNQIEELEKDISDWNIAEQAAYAARISAHLGLYVSRALTY